MYMYIYVYIYTYIAANKCTAYFRAAIWTMDDCEICATFRQEMTYVILQTMILSIFI